MLCVTITIVYRSRSSKIKSSIRAVEAGSSADAGSSISSTSGSVASARAMHSRCCCPPESCSAESFSRSCTSSHSAARVSDFSTISYSTCLAANAGHARPVRHVLENRLRKRVRLLKHHADPLPQLDHVDLAARRMSSPSSRISPSTRVPSIKSFIRLRHRRNVLLPQPDGPMSAVTQCCGIVSDTSVSACFAP